MKETLEGKLKADGYDEAIMGIVQRAGQEPVILYDTDKVLEILISRDEMIDINLLCKFSLVFQILDAHCGVISLPSSQ